MLCCSKSLYVFHPQDTTKNSTPKQLIPLFSQNHQKTQKFTLFTSISTSIKPFIQAKNPHLFHTKNHQKHLLSLHSPSKILINKALSRTPLIPKHFHHISNLTLLSQITHHHPSTLPSTSKTSLL